MGLTYAVSDLHGRFDLLEMALVELKKREPGTVVFTGDYVDRGPQSRQVIERLIAGPPPDWKWICLKGNHEAMMVETLMMPRDPGWWLSNGGAETLLSYGHGIREAYRPEVVPPGHRSWLAALPLLHADELRVFVHAAIDPAADLDQQSEKTLLWFRYPPTDTDGYRGRHLVHGHDPNTDGPLCLSGRTNLDTLAWGTGRLVIGVFSDDRPGGPVDFIEVRGPADARFASAIG